jgi:LDH2 family malate/lactate/ureidoglycolate dehydrogenase
VSDLSELSAMNQRSAAERVDAAPIRIDAARDFSVRAYVAQGMAPDDAATVTENALWADLRGVDTHGLQRLSWYAKWFSDGRCSPKTQVEIVSEKPTALVGDGHSGLGQLVATRFVQQLIPKAVDNGMAIGVLRNSNDWGCGAWYPNLAAEAGLVAMATTTSIPNLAPFGARTRLFGNNPIAFAFPRRTDKPIIFDAALTPVALGKVLRAQAEGKELPLEWGFKDRDGVPTTDPTVAMAGIIPAIGGYKGTGLAMVTNLLAGVLSGSSHTGGVDVGKRGQFFMFVDPGWLNERDAWFDAVEDMVAQVRAAEVLPGESVFLPGEPEWRTMERRLAEGRITYPGSVLASLDRLAAQLQIEPLDKGD